MRFICPTTTPEAYKQMAIDLAMHPEKLAFHQAYRSGIFHNVRALSG
jgi:hypothetical protein